MVVGGLLPNASYSAKGLLSSDTAGFANFRTYWLYANEISIGVSNSPICTLLCTHLDYGVNTCSYLVTMGDQNILGSYKIAGNGTLSFRRDGNTLYCTGIYDRSLAVMVISPSNTFTFA